MESDQKKKLDLKVPEPTLRRLPWYLSHLKLVRKRGQKYISSTQIAKDIDVDPSQVAKDLSYTKIVGKTRVGYEVEPLIDVLEDFLGFRVLHEAYLFGAGSLGASLLHDDGMKQFGLIPSAAFDVNPHLINKEVNGVKIYSIDSFKAMRKVSGVKIGILTVPVEKAQDVAEFMIEGGIQAIWNFTPVRIRVPENIIVQNTSLYAHLAVMFNKLNTLSAKEKSED